MVTDPSDIKSPDVFSLPCISLYTTPASWPVGSMWCTWQVANERISRLSEQRPSTPMTNLRHKTVLHCENNAEDGIYYHIPSFCDCWKKYMVDKYWEQLKKTLSPSRGHRISSMISIRVCISSLRKATVCKKVQHSFVGVLLRSHEYQTGKEK